MKKKLSAVLLIVAISLTVIWFAFPSALTTLAVGAERKTAGLAKKSVMVDEHKIYYLEGGRGDTVLLLHGYSADKDNWTRFAKSLTSRYRVIIPDLPGFGESTGLPEANYDIESQVARLDRFVTTLNLGVFHIAGNSMGGQIAGTYSAKFPQKVASVALLAPGGLNSPNRSQFNRLMEKGINPLVVNGPDDYDRLISFVFVRPPYIPGPVKKSFAQKAHANKPFNEKVMRDLTEKPVSLEPFLDHIQAPVLVIWGDSDRVLDISGTGILEKHIRNCRTVIMKECGHVPMLERPGEAAGYYLDFLSQK